MKTVLETHESIKSEAEQRLSTSAKPRIINSMKPGQWFRQGDVYVEMISEEAKPHEDYTFPTLDHQVAFGTTKGSRHVLKENPSLRILKKKEPGVLDGPMFYSKEPIALEHPEHADFHMPAGSYFVTLQQDFAQEELARAKD